MQKIHVEGDPKLKNNSGKQYSMFIGRWQPWHDGHRWLIDQRLEQGKNVLICIRDIEPKGFELIVMDGFLTKDTVHKTKEIVLSNTIEDKNYTNNLLLTYFLSLSLKYDIKFSKINIFHGNPIITFNNV